MGKKKSGRRRSINAAGAGEDNKAFVLRVPTHCGCDGCGDRLRSGVRDLALRCDGVVSLDTSALATKGELAVVAAAEVDPERLRRRLRKHTGKKTVDLVFPNTNGGGGGGGEEEDADDTTAAAVLAGLQLGGGVHGLHHGRAMPAYQAGYGQGQGQVVYPWPWVVQQQQLQAAPPEPEPYLVSYPHGGGGWLGY